MSRLQGSSTISRSNSLRSNSLPRDIRTPRTPLSSLNTRFETLYFLLLVNMIHLHVFKFKILLSNYNMYLTA